MKIRFFPVLKFSLIFLTILVFSCDTPQNSTFNRLMYYANTVKVINTHEHQRVPGDLEFKKFNFWTLLSKAYLSADLVSSGGNHLSPEIINNKSLNELWNENAEFLKYNSTTSYYQHFYEGIKKCYGYKDPEFTKESVESLSKEISETVSKIPGLGHIPILGKLFTSTRYQNKESDLIIIVTPQIIQAINDDALKDVEKIEEDVFNEEKTK